MASVDTHSELSHIAYSAAQTRVINAALELFSQHGVSGTSLQMIADTIGVTKAAVYHQFKSKEAIVLAVAEVELSGLEAVLDIVEAEGSTARARDLLLTHVIDLAVKRRGAVSTLQTDPVMIRFLAQHEPFQHLMDRLFSVLLGDDKTSVGPRVQAAMLSAAIGGAVAHPFIADLDDDTLKAELLHYTRRLVQLPD